jgi:hypothetical protein
MFEFNNEYIDFSKSEVIQNKKSEDYNVSYKTFKEKFPDIDIQKKNPTLLYLPKCLNF